MDQSQKRVVEEVSRFEDWFDKYEYLIGLGNELEPMGKYKTDENTISGCQSELWIYGEVENANMHFYGDSDTKITKGILALILRMVNGQSPEEIANSGFEFIEETGLGSNLSPARSNGVKAMIKKIKDTARGYCDT